MDTVMQIKLIMLYSGILLAIYLITLLLVGPLNFIGKVIMKGLIGGTAIFTFNFIMELLNLNFYIGVNTITSILTGYLGISGIALVSFIKYIFM